MLAVCYGPVTPIARTELLDGCYDLFHVKCRNSLELQLSVIIDLIVLISLVDGNCMHERAAN